MKKLLASVLTLSVLSTAAQASAPVVPPTPARSGIDLSHVDPAVRAQDDFFAHLNGHWLKTAEIPADRPSWGSFAMVGEVTQARLKELVEQAASGPAAPGSDACKIGDLYLSFMDESKIDALGLAPLQGELARIAAITTHAGLAPWFAHAQLRGVGAPVGFVIHQDNRDSTRYIADLTQGGLGMPDRDYFLKADDARLAAIKAAYGEHVARTLALAGDAQAAAHAAAIVDLETRLARIQWSRVDNRDPVKTYNKVDIAALPQLAPGFDWTAYLTAAGIAQRSSYVIVSQPSYLTAFAALAPQVPLATWKAYLQWRTLRGYASFLSKPFADEQFAFYRTTLAGVTQAPPRWKQAVSIIEQSLGEMVGKLYVEKHFPAAHKERVETMVRNLLAAMRASLQTLDWMGPATKQAALAKLGTVVTKIGYPGRWTDFSSLAITKDDLVGNLMRAEEFNTRRQVAKLGGPIDRNEWHLAPQAISAYYNGEQNEIVFPAGILQKPFFDPDADEAVNYGAIGAVIGHEISHGFDDKGSRYDGAGNLRDWWTAADHAQFEAKAQMLVRQYDAFEPVPGYHVNGTLTIGENIADNAGLAIAFKAWRLSLKGQPSRVLDGLTGAQRFYTGLAQVWRMKMREPAQIQQIKSDPHAPAMARVNGTVRNQPGFYEAYSVKPGDRMYLPPAERVIMW